MGSRHDAFHSTDDLVWKIAYFAFEVEDGFTAKFKALPEHERFQAFRRGLKWCYFYAYGRAIDDEFAPLSADFYELFATFIAIVGAARNGTKSEHIFSDGAPEIAADLATCLLRFEGFRLQPGMTAPRFRQRVLDAFTGASLRTPSAIGADIEEAVRQNWRFVGDPDVDAFTPVWSFRELQGGRLDSLLQSY